MSNLKAAEFGILDKFYKLNYYRAVFVIEHLAINTGSLNRRARFRPAEGQVVSWKIQIYRAKPNPQGKDTSRWHVPKPEQLLGEWVDLKNIGDAPASLSLLHLAHTEYGANCSPQNARAIYWNGSSGSLQPGQILRVHTGKSTDASQMRHEDRLGADFHAYAESGSFVLNNDCGDALSLLWTSSGQQYLEDAAAYGPTPPEGKVLVRVGEKLV